MASWWQVITQVGLLTWALWAQWSGVAAVNDQVVLQAPVDASWRYQEGFDTKADCAARRKALIVAQEVALAVLTPDDDLSLFRYKIWRCYPVGLDPTALTRHPFTEE